MRGEQAILAFNRGMLSRLAMARTDLKRYGLSAQVQTNWMSRVLGSSMLRPGKGYLGGVNDHLPAKFLPFVYSATDTALIELTDLTMRIWVDDALVTRPAVTAPITNGDFGTDLSGWSDQDQGAAVSVWVTGGYMGLTGDNANAAIRRQAVTTANPNVQHALRIVVQQGQVDVLVGTGAGLSEYVNVSLTPGTHSLAFTPTGNFSIDVQSRSPYQALLNSINIEGAGVMEIPTPWAESDLSMVRQDQSGDIVFVACEGIQQQKIERRGPSSWSVVTYETDSGPFRVINTSETTISNSSITGYTTLTASAPVFRSGHVGAIFRLESIGQRADRTFTAASQEGGKVIVTGVGAARSYIVSITGTFSMTITQQRSVGDTGVWEDTGLTFTTPTFVAINDALDNQIVAYRFVVKVGDYVSGSAVTYISFPTGSITGVVRITSVAGPTSASGYVLTTLGNNSATPNWAEGAWSDYRGWPSAVCLCEARLWFAGKDKFYGSVTDDFANFDSTTEGDAAPITRSIGSGPVDTINWLLPMQRLMAGTDGSIVAGRSSSFEEPLTSTNFNPKPTITQGCARIPAVKIDGSGMFVQRGGTRVLSMAYSVNDNDYAAEDMSALVPEVCKPSIVSFAAQRQPDTRVHAVRFDGKVALMIYDKLEDVRCWGVIETDGFIEDVCVLPGNDEDAVYYVVRRVIGGVDKRYLERLAREDESIGGTLNKQADSFIIYSGAPTATISGLDHLEGKDVIVWADGRDLSPGNGDDQVKYTVTGGSITLNEQVSEAVVGLGYEALFRSAKLAYLAEPGTSGLSTRKRIHSLAVVTADMHAKGLVYGKDFDTMDDMPAMEAFELVDEDHIWDEYNYEAFSFPGEWEVDARLCLKATAPRPCTLLAAVVGMNANPTS